MKMAHLGYGESREAVREKKEKRMPPSLPASSPSEPPVEETSEEPPKELTLEDVMYCLEEMGKSQEKRFREFEEKVMKKVQSIENYVATVRVEVPKEVLVEKAVPVQRFQKAFGKGKKRWWWMSVGEKRQILSEERMKEMGLKYGEEVE